LSLAASLSRAPRSEEVIDSRLRCRVEVAMVPRTGSLAALLVFLLSCGRTPQEEQVIADLVPAGLPLHDTP
jgi:hypothetical protein